MSQSRSMVPLRIVSACALSVLGGLPVFLLGVQSAYVRDDLEFGPAGLGIAVGCFFGAAAVGAAVFGLLADLVSERTSMVVAGSLCASGGAGVVLWSDSWALLVVWMGVLGSGNAACQVTANLSMARSIPAHRRGFGFAVKQSAIPVAVLIAGLSVSVASSGPGWRAPYVVTGLAGLLVVGVGLLRRGGTVTRRSSVVDADLPALVPLVLLMVGMTLASAAANAMASFVPSWGHEMGVSPAHAGLVMAAGSGLNIAVRLIAGGLADRRHGRNLPVVATQMVIGGVALAVLSMAEVTLFVPATLLGFALGWSWPGLLMFAVVRVSRDGPGRASGMMQAGAFAGGATGPLIFGLLVDIAGFESAWRVGSVGFLVAAVLVVLARRMIVTDLVERPPREPLGYGGGRVAPRRVASREHPPT